MQITLEKLSRNTTPTFPKFSANQSNNFEKLSRNTTPTFQKFNANVHLISFPTFVTTNSDNLYLMYLKKILKISLYFFLSILLAYLIFVFSFGGFGQKPEVVLSPENDLEKLLFAHRGIYLYYPENSREGVQAARKHGFGATELDIRRSADNQFIVFHDETCDSILGLDQKIDSLSVSDLKKYPIILHNGTRSNAVVVTVDEFLSSEKKNMIFYFDMKFSSFKDADEIVALIKKQNCERSVILTNWNLFFIFYVEAKYPEIITGLEGFDAGKEWLYPLIPKDLKPDFLSGFYSNTNQKHLNWLKKNNLINSKIIYGVDSLNYDAALNSGYKNIIIDYDSTLGKDSRIRNLLTH